jgi:hypothetical protein
MPDQLNATLAELNRTLSVMDETMKVTQAAIIKAAGDAARAAEDVKRERWFRRVTLVCLVIMAFGLGGFLYDTRAEAEREKRLTEAAEHEACLRANRTREQIQDAIVFGVIETLAKAEGDIDEREAMLIAAVSARVDEIIPERDCG